MKIKDLAAGDWFLAHMDGNPGFVTDAFVAGELRADGFVRTCTNLKTGGVSNWHSDLPIERVADDFKGEAIDLATLSPDA